MATPEENRLIIELANITNLSDWLQRIDESSINGIVDSITYNPQSRTVILQMRNHLIREANDLERRHSRIDQVMEDIARLSRQFSSQYPELLNRFKDWKPHREKLVQTSSNCADSIDTNFALASAFRIITSTADIVGTLMRYQQSESYWVHFAAENSSYCGLFSLFLEMMFSKKLFNRVRKATEKDQEMFRPVKDWLQQTEELDQSVRSLFPYGIDEDLVRRIHRSCSDSDNSVKIFMSVVASNVRNNISLFRNMDFLETVEMFSASEVGVQWYQKVILENDPVWIECMKCNVEEQIRSITPISREGHPDLIVNGSLVLTRGMKFKILLNIVTIYSAVSNLWDGNKCEESNTLREFARKTDRELNGMKTVLRHLKPRGMDIDEDLI